jgi:hypothetical protein
MATIKRFEDLEICQFAREIENKVFGTLLRVLEEEAGWNLCSF